MLTIHYHTFQLIPFLVGINSDTAYGTRTYNPSKRTSIGGTKRAYNSLFHAFICVVPGDTIQMRAGTYEESFDLLISKVFTKENKAI